MDLDRKLSTKPEWAWTVEELRHLCTKYAVKQVDSYGEPLDREGLLVALDLASKGLGELRGQCSHAYGTGYCREPGTYGKSAVSKSRKSRGRKSRGRKSRRKSRKSHKSRRASRGRSCTRAVRTRAYDPDWYDAPYARALSDDKIRALGGIGGIPGLQGGAAMTDFDPQGQVGLKGGIPFSDYA